MATEGSFSLLAFSGVPYLVTRVIAGLNHFILLPEDSSREEMEEIARLQVEANRLHACLALGMRSGIWYEPDGSSGPSEGIPMGGLVVCEKLRPPRDFMPTADLIQRTQAFHAFEKLCNHGYLVPRGSPDEVRCATSQELQDLAGRQENGVPRGLAQCPRCREWRGECLGRGYYIDGKVVTVRCRCENWNRCARCGEPLAGRRLNAYNYGVSDDQIWHTPGFCGLSHRCPDQRDRAEAPTTSSSSHE